MYHTPQSLLMTVVGATLKSYKTKGNMSITFMVWLINCYLINKGDILNVKR